MYQSAPEYSPKQIHYLLLNYIFSRTEGAWGWVAETHHTNSVRNLKAYLPNLLFFYRRLIFRCPLQVSSQGHNSPIFLPIYDRFSHPFCLFLITTCFWHFTVCLTPLTLNVCFLHANASLSLAPSLTVWIGEGRPWGHHESDVAAGGHLVSVLYALHMPMSDGTLYQGFESCPMGWGHLACSRVPSCLPETVSCIPPRLGIQDTGVFFLLLSPCNNSALFLPIYDRLSYL